MIDLQSISNDVKPLILQAGGMILNTWQENRFNSHFKDDRDVVTDTDIEVEKFLRKQLYKILPQAGFIVEEGKTEIHGEYNWTIDPIDGTKYFVSQVALFFTQISLLKDNEPVISFIYNPITKQLFHAIKGFGAYMNDARLERRAHLPLAKCITHFDLGPTLGVENEWKYAIFQKIAQKTYRVRVTAGYLAPYLPLGAVDISVNTAIETPYSTKNITDLAPHKLLLTEAGYEEERLGFEGHPLLIWASKQHISAIKDILANR